jgi:ABC-2 type transport system permease protein/lipopolysaccharide transport system permease protein
MREQTIYEGVDQSNFYEYSQNLGQELFFFRYAWYNFVRNGLRLRYRRSNLGFLWNLLNPLLTMTVMSIAFSFVFQVDFGTFAFFLFSGQVSFIFINASILGATQSISNSEGFLKKVYIPKVLFPLVTVSIEVINYWFSLIALLIIALVLGAKLTWLVFLLPLAFIPMFLFVMGLGMAVSVLYIYFRDLSNILVVLFTALFYATPILYPESRIPPDFQFILNLNPLTYFVRLSRGLILGDTPLTFSDWLIPIVLGVAAFLMGLMIFHRKDRDLIFRL